MKFWVLKLLIAIGFFANGQSNTRMIGQKNYELTNHLDNVLQVSTDRKVQKNTEVQIVAYNDYYPYGMLMEGRYEQKDTISYRYAFQGQEKDDEIKDTGNSYNYTYRMHDSRLGRFFAVDPLASKYPHYSSYQFSGNKVISHVESKGLNEDPANKNPNKWDEECGCYKNKNEKIKPTETEVDGREVIAWTYRAKWQAKDSKKPTKVGLRNRILNLFRHVSSPRKKGHKQELWHSWHPTYKPFVEPKQKKKIQEAPEMSSEEWLGSESNYSFGFYSLEKEDGVLMHNEIGEINSGLTGVTIKSSGEPLQFNKSGDIINSTGEVLYKRMNGLPPDPLIVPYEQFDETGYTNQANRRFAPGEMKPVNRGTQVYEEREDGLFYNITQKLIDEN